jgi:tetratricopeptide (TPR) repeat protein
MNSKRKAIVWTVGLLTVIGVVFAVVYTHYHNKASKQEIKYAKEQLAKKSYYQAMLGVGRAIYYKKSNPDAYFIWGQIEIEKHQNYPQAAYCFSQAIDYAGKPNAAMFYLRGKCYYKMEQYAKAHKDLKASSQMGGQADSLNYYLKASKNKL